jgi:hypothetical protein
MSDIEQELGWMTRSPYTEGWPKNVAYDDLIEDRPGAETLPTHLRVVPLSDAERLREEVEALKNARAHCVRNMAENERLREALEKISLLENRWTLDTARGLAAAALDREGEECPDCGSHQREVTGPQRWPYCGNPWHTALDRKGEEQQYRRVASILDRGGEE